MSRDDRAVIEEIRFNEKYAHLFKSEYSPGKYSADSVPSIKKKTLFTQDYLKRLTQSPHTGVYPPNCRFIEELQNGYLVIIEEPPAFRTISVSMSMGNEITRLTNAQKADIIGLDEWRKRNPRQPYKFTLAMPYVIFQLYISKYHEIQDTQIYLRTQQMTGLSDYLLKAPMLNISDGGHVCMGSKVGGRFRSLTAAIQHAVMVFWSATFNTDYTYNYNAYKDVPILNSYIEWEYMSNANPMFIYTADWIKMPFTIGGMMEQSKANMNLSSKRAMGYRELADVFFTTQETEMKAKSYKSAKHKMSLYADIAQGTYLTEDVDMNQGDSITMKDGRTAFVDSFIGFADGSDVQYIQFDLEGKKFLVKLHKKAKIFLADQLKSQRRADQVTLPNGEVVKPDDILEIQLGRSKVYYRVEYIRRSRGMDGEDVFEIRAMNDYFLSSSINATVFKLDAPKIDGIKIDPNEQYVVIGDANHAGAMTTGYRMKYEKFDVSGEGNITLKFKNAHPKVARIGRTYKSISLSKQKRRKILYEVDTVKRINGPFYCGRQLNYMSDGDGPADEVVWGIDGVIVRDGNFSMNRVSGSMTKQLLDGDRFFVQGAATDIEFKIGDKVVCANWKTPLDVLTVKMIQGFKYDESTGNISFILADREGTLSEQVYVVSGRSSVIKTGTVRKVTNKVGRLTAGTKIQATRAGIPCFPKKDTNIIVAFIIDTGGEPLVLCSNGCTLWLSDVQEHFKRITMKSKRWAKLEHAPLDLSKIKFQAGDIINGQSEYKNRFGYLLQNPSPTRALRAMPLEYYGGYPESYCLDSYMTRECILDCIPAPRVTPAMAARMGSLKGIYDIQTYDVHENNVETTYINQRRS